MALALKQTWVTICISTWRSAAQCTFARRCLRGSATLLDPSGCPATSIALKSRSMSVSRSSIEEEKGPAGEGASPARRRTLPTPTLLKASTQSLSCSWLQTALAARCGTATIPSSRNLAQRDTISSFGVPGIAATYTLVPGGSRSAWLETDNDDFGVVSIEKSWRRSAAGASLLPSPDTERIRLGLLATRAAAVSTGARR
mmetsp:Transcript_32189/g.64633  ORF Transcript_32189/g.64633 Transcript_32189/m.64633 type:complete len:200 (-) Transcript_32189:112-711(-)